MKKAHFNKESCIKVVGEYKEVPLDQLNLDDELEFEPVEQPKQTN